MSNEPKWLTDIDRKIGKISIQFNEVLRELRRALHSEHELEEENKQLRALSNNSQLLKESLSQDARFVLRCIILYDCEKTYRVQQILHDRFDRSASQDEIDHIEEELRAFAQALRPIESISPLALPRNEKPKRKESE